MTGQARDAANARTDSVTRVAEIRQENRGGDVAARDIEWLCDEVMRLRGVMQAVIANSIGTPEVAKNYMKARLR